MIRIAIAEDNPNSLKALQNKLSGYKDLEIKIHSGNGRDLIEYLEKDQMIDLILMDIEMPVLSGILATEKIKRKYPLIKIVIITVYDDDENIFNAILAGADSYILKDTKSEKIYETINDTINGGAVMSPSIALKALLALKKNPYLNRELQIPDAYDLSPREAQLLKHLCDGLTNKNIAEKLFISTFTVKRHIENIYRKLQAQNRIDLVNKAKGSGLI